MTSRRNFIKVGGLAGGGLLMSLTTPFIVKDKETYSFSSDQEIEFNKFLSIAANGIITIMLTKHEMGQGTGTSIPTILADELGADWSKVQIKKSDYDPQYTWAEMGTTGGSGSIERTWDTIREVGATARDMLKQAAASQWGVDTMALKVENSFVTNLATNEKLEFGELAEAASQLPVPEEVLLKKSKDYVYIGKPIKNRITKKVVSGNARFGIDMDIPEMVYASIEKCPVFQGKLMDFDATEARKVAGVLDIFPLVLSEEVQSKVHPKRGYVNEGVVVVADSTWTAFKARKLLKIQWDFGQHGTRSIVLLEKEMALARKTAPMTFEIGNMEQVFEDNGNEIIEAEYNNPHQAHALMEPINATARYEGDHCEIWVGAQDPSVVHTEVSHVTGLPSDAVSVHILNSGGSFGRRYHVDSSMEAAFISKKMKLPVKVTWSREDEIMHDHFHPCLRNYLKAAVSSDGKVTGLENIAISTTGYATWSNKWNQYYAFPHMRCYLAKVPTLVAEGAWRSTAEHSANLAKECFIDELVEKLGKDAVDFRLELLSREVDWGDPSQFPGWVRNYFLPRKKLIRQRHIEVLKFVKENGLWEKEMPKGKGKGFAISNFGDTICAEIAEVTLDESESGFHVDKVTAVVHCGMVVNPHFGKGQIEGGIIWALTALKYGGLEVENGIVQKTNFHNCKVLRMDESPEIEVVFIESDERPTGLGEPGTPPLAPAVLNALFDVSGKRIRKMPVTRQDIHGMDT
ncbi:molybdopterin cofactor-binding domain-containing protein [Ulvibacterium sp.]|uniref:xanthine dehydrogenase family protein molybdopterin-binding subunit n=1 Tax=Ulvibacterium sp. TaxID=2665914 RepID=UPI003BA8790A